MPMRLKAPTIGSFVGPGLLFAELAAFVPLQQQVRSFQFSTATVPFNASVLFSRARSRSTPVTGMMAHIGWPG